jgi:class 3 adenylate cyclase/tetratricopeptide (TPR) repeat protein
MTPELGSPASAGASRDGAFCPTCGEANPDRARFCASCGAALAPPAPAREVRKTVTTLFCDVVESSVLGEQSDPELVRRVLSRFFDEMRVVIERHGGTVEKFIGDEVMAVFGVPTTHEDDAVRAVRAAAEMRARLRRLNDEFEREAGVSLQTRMGINTGEVVAGDPSSGHAFVTGDSVNLAKRIQQAARPGEILIGTATYPLVKDAVEAGPPQTFSVKGKAEPVLPRRLDAVDATAPGLARRFDAPLVGRDRELGVLSGVFEDTVRTRSSRLVTVLGPPGIGKSRLAHELLAAVRDRATPLTGRCLPYGEGITFWPLRQIVREAGGEAGVEAALAGEEDAELIADHIRATIGRSPAGGGAHETFWAFRRFFEGLADRRPLVVCFEDIHWAEPTLLDLIEYVVNWSRAVPMLLVCMARPDLLDTRPSWAAPAANATLLSLEPLSAVAADALLEGLEDDAELTAESRTRIMEAAEGNPLFLEQMAAMITVEGESADRLAVPPSIQALLGERLDRLDERERTVIEHASVIGKEFWRGALLELLPAEHGAEAGSHLMALVRKGLLRPDVSPVPGEDAFRFRHVLIRDAAYGGISKDLRAELHERLADWLERTAAERAVELEEIIGYHLEQAHVYRKRLAPADPRAATLASRAATLLGGAGRRAFVRGDMPAAAGLLTRATVLLVDEDRARLELAPDLGDALVETGEWERAEGLLDRAIADAEAIADRRLAARAQVAWSAIRLVREPDGPTEHVRRIAEAAIDVFTEEGDEVGLARAWRHLSRVYLVSSEWAPQREALERALVHAQRAGDRREKAMVLGQLALCVYWGPTPVGEAIARCEEMLSQSGGDRTAEAGVTVVMGGLEAMRGQLDRARMLYRRSKEILSDLGLTPRLAAHTLVLFSIETLAGDPAVAEEELRFGVETLDELGARLSLATLAPLLAETSLAQGRHDEAERLIEQARQAAVSEDILSQVLWRTALARLLASRGDDEAAERRAREAVAFAGETDALNLHADSLVALAEVLQHSGQDRAADDALAEAVRLYALKGNEVSEARATALRRQTVLDP